MAPMLRGDQLFRNDQQFDGMIGGDVTVAAGVTLRLSGMVGGNLIIEPRATVHLGAMVAGNVINKGGTVLSER